MGIKIKQISIKNFKLFDNLETITFQDLTLVVLDGPNGFGKTSFYDALELLFTGKLRRYSFLSSVIDARQRISDNPILCNKASLEDELIIKAELEINGIPFFLMRKESCRSLLDNIDFKTFSLPLFQLERYDLNTGTLVEESDVFFNNLLNVDFNKNFGFLNYIEQEDNTYLLKKKDKDRHAGISHLFNTDEVESKIKTLEIVRDKLNNACNPAAKIAYENILNQKNEYISNLINTTEAIEYVKLFESKNSLLWDKEELDFSSDNYLNWLGEAGELNKIIFFVKNFEDFEKKIHNDKLVQLIESSTPVKNLINFYKFLDNIDELKSKLDLNDKVSEYIKNFEKGILSAFQDDKIDVSEELGNIFKTFIDLEKYKEHIVLIKDKLSTSTKFETLLNNLKESRESLLTNYKEHIEKHSETMCPLCGYDWKVTKDLLDNIEKQSAVLTELIHNNGGDLNTLLDNFSKEFILPLSEKIKSFLIENKSDKNYVNQLIEIKKQESTIKDYKTKFQELGIDLDIYYNNEATTVQNIDEIITRINVAVQEKKKDFNIENIKDYFPSYYLQYFDENKANLLSEKQIVQKKNYINWKYSSYQNLEINRLETEYTIKKTLYDNALNIKTKISKIIKTYKDELKEYQEKLIKDIEILFHIYSGRIMQDYQNGLGIFIKADSIGIRFIESVKIDDSTGIADYNKYDAVFSMSSGQLASLVISFTLALNKRYSKSKLLLIDDPVQTLDELNIAGFVNLLRNEFSDRQIFMSTHEQMMSAYMRYKFEKFSLPTMQIDFKEIFNG